MPRTLLLAGVVSFATLGIGTAFTRSTIPRTFSGKVTRIDKYVQDHAGVDDVYFLSVGSDRMVVDRAVTLGLHRGDLVHKTRFSRTLTVNGRPERLHLSRDFHHMFFAYPLIGLLTALALFGLPRGAARRLGFRRSA